MSKKVLIIFILAFVYTCQAENIDPNDDDSQYGWGENIGWVNFEPSAADPNAGAQVASDKVTGFIWAENIGWINLCPRNYGGVLNDGQGNLSGCAWGENIGWINFNPQVPGDPTDYGVKIDQQGNFSGWAWGENIGWINFNSPDIYDQGVQVCTVNYVDLSTLAEQWLQADMGLSADLVPDDNVEFRDYST
ncbi:MAG: hypothetical protein J7M40_12305, partial [Planctomycetes bacterium]|nr:hypothetical protein [Planctomycetota bacterium]